MSDRWGCTARELLARIDSHELAERMALEQINPKGEHRQDLRHAQLCRAVYITGFRYRDAKMTEFMLDTRPRRQQNPADAWMRWAAMSGGRIKKD